MRVPIMTAEERQEAEWLAQAYAELDGILSPRFDRG
jgi:hypothetical protein